MSKVPDDYRQVAYTIMRGSATIAVFTPEVSQIEITKICASLNQAIEATETKEEDK